MMVNARNGRLCMTLIAAFLGALAAKIGYASDRSYPLSENGRASHAIVVSAQASPSEQHAAAELRDFLAKVVEGPMVVVREDDPRAKAPARIFIGMGKAADAALRRSQSKPVDMDGLGDEGFIIRTLPLTNDEPIDVVIAGGRLRGTMSNSACSRRSGSSAPVAPMSLRGGRADTLLGR